MLRFKSELDRSKDQKLSLAVKIINDVKQHGNHVTAMLSMNDLLQLGGYTAVEYCGGPSMIFRMGRKDIDSETEAGNQIAIASDSHENAVQV